MALFALKRNQQGLLVLGAVVIIIAVFAFANKKDDMHVTDVGVSSTDRQAESAAKPSPTQQKAPAIITPSVTGLNGSTFRLSAYNGHILPDATNYLVSFEIGSPPFNDGVIRAKFCNTLTAQYRLKGRVLQGGVTGTKMYCAEPKDVMDLEGAFGVLVGSSAQVTLQGDALTLSDGVKTMVFIRQ